MVAILHGLGFAVLAAFDWIERSEFSSTVRLSFACANQQIPITALLYIIRVLELAIPIAVRRLEFSRMSNIASVGVTHNSRLIQSLSLLALGMALSTLSTLNFSLSFFVGLLCAPLTFIRPLGSLARRRIWAALLTICLLQLISPVNWIYLIARMEFGKSAVEVVQFFRFAWKVWGTWTPFVWWCIWWPAWTAGMIVLLSAV